MRTRGEAARLAKINDSGVSTALDDSLLVLTAYEGHSIEDLAGDLSFFSDKRSEAPLWRRIKK